MGEVNLVMAREDILDGPSVFLAGPTAVAGSGVPSWRPDAVAEIERQWQDDRPLTVLSPESRGGKRAKRYEDQWHWENVARAQATVIMFWIPRDEQLMPGFTTNTEFGFDVASKRAVVLGCPPDCPSPQRNRYLIRLAHVAGVPTTITLADTAAAAISLILGTADHIGE